MGGKLNFRMRAFVTYASIALSGGMNIFAFRYLVLEDILPLYCFLLKFSQLCLPPCWHPCHLLLQGGKMQPACRRRYELMSYTRY